MVSVSKRLHENVSFVQNVLRLFPEWLSEYLDNLFSSNKNKFAFCGHSLEFEGDVFDTELGGKSESGRPGN